MKRLLQGIGLFVLTATIGAALVQVRGAMAQSGLATSGPGLKQPGTSSVMGYGATGPRTSCSGDAVVYDNNGVQGCQRTTDTAPQGLLIRPQAAFPGGTQTAANTVIAGGQDETIYTIVDTGAPACSTDTMTVTVVNSNGTSTASALVEATNWNMALFPDAGIDPNTTATNLAAAVDALAGVSAAAASNVVRISLDLSTASVATVSSDTACATRSDGTSGNIQFWSQGVQQWEVSPTSFAPSSNVTDDLGSTSMRIATTHTNALRLSGGGVITNSDGVARLHVDPQLSVAAASTYGLRWTGVTTGSLATCAAGVAGSVQYDTTTTTMKWCNGTAPWKDVSPVNLTFSSTAPTVIACTAPTMTWNNGTALFQFDVGGTCAGISTATVTLPTATNGWLCTCAHVTTPASFVVAQSSGTTTTCVVTNYSRTTGLATAWTDADDVRCSAVGG